MTGAEEDRSFVEAARRAKRAALEAAGIAAFEYKLAGYEQARDFWERESRWWMSQYRRVAEQLNLPWYTRLWRWVVSLV